MNYSHRATTKQEPDCTSFYIKCDSHCSVHMRASETFSFIDRDALMNITKAAHIKTGNGQSFSYPAYYFTCLFSGMFFSYGSCQRQFVNEILQCCTSNHIGSAAFLCNCLYISTVFCIYTVQDECKLYPAQLWIWSLHAAEPVFLLHNTERAALKNITKPAPAKKGMLESYSNSMLESYSSYSNFFVKHLNYYLVETLLKLIIYIHINY